MTAVDLYGVEFTVAAIVILIGGVARGFGGFGSSIIWIVGLTLVLPPVEAVPIIFVLEVGASMSLWLSARRDVDWSSARPLIVGTMLGLPVGVWVLASLDADRMTKIIAIIAVVSAVAVSRGLRLKRRIGPIGTGAVGIAAGALNGMSSAGGPPVILYYMTSPNTVAASRASMIVFFGVMDLAALIMVWFADMMYLVTITRALAFAPVMLVGTWIGRKGFERFTEERARTITVGILMTVSVVALYSAFR